MSELKSKSRRQFIKKSAYAVPVVMTLKAAPSLAGQGSHHNDYPKKKKEKDKHKSNKKNDNKNRGRGW